MKIYEAEKTDGIADLIKANASIAYLSKARKSVNPIILETEKFATKANANPNQFDLYYLDSILVSTGWNLNDDVFDSDETWLAKSTPVDKMFNYMHDEKDIIGHITSASIMEDEELYEGEDAPDSFHIVVGSVLYRVWNDEKLKARMDTLIEEIEADKWYVSMECLFSNFDYAMVDKDGNQSIVKRTKTTAFLSKHLRAYGGQGIYDGQKVGRLLRNITFSGKGLVDEPANPSSIILNDITLTKSFRTNITVASKQENTMTEEIFKAQAAELKQQNEELKTKLSTLEADFQAKAQKEHAAEVEKLTKTVADLQVQVESQNTLVTEKDKAIAESVQKVTEAQAKLDEALKEVETLKASIKTAERVNQLTIAGVDSTEHDALITKYAAVSDDVFNDIVELHAKFVPFKKKDEKKDDKETKAEDMEKTECEKEAEAKKAKEATEALDKSEASKTAPAGVPEEKDKTQEVRASASKWIANTFKTSASANIRKLSKETK
jgi:hypothetical protein